METITVKELQKYKSVIEVNTMMKITEAMLRGIKTVDVPTGTLCELKRKLQEKKAQDMILKTCARLNDKGKALEKAGKIKTAIKIYETNILDGCYPAHHSYKRLIILYNKQNDYDNALRVIKLARIKFPNEPYYTERYYKTLTLKAKSKK